MKEHATNYARESAEMWLLLGKLAKGTEAAQEETRDLRRMMESAQKESRELRNMIRALIDSRRATNGHRKR